MSTILSKRNITVQKHIREVEDIEDMKNFLKCLYRVREELPKLDEELKPISVLESTDQFKIQWKQLTGLNTLNKFNSTYNLPEWRCRVGLHSVYIKSISNISMTYALFSLVYSDYDNEDVDLIVSSCNCEDIHFDKIANVLRQIDGVREVESYYEDDAVFKIDISKL